MKKISLLVALAVFSVFISCSKEDITETEKNETEKTNDDYKLKDDSIVEENTNDENTNGENNEDKNTNEDNKKEKTELEKKIVGKWEVTKIKKLFWFNIRKKNGQEVYISFSENGDYNAQIDVKKEFSGQGTYKSTNETTIKVDGNVKAIISNIIFTNINTLEADILANGQSVTIRAVRK